MNTLEDAYIDIARQEEHLLAGLQEKKLEKSVIFIKNGPNE